MPDEGPFENTDCELWREREGDHYSPSIHVTKDGSIGINVAGHVIVMPLGNWHSLAKASLSLPRPVQPPAVESGEHEMLVSIKNRLGALLLQADAEVAVATQSAAAVQGMYDDLVALLEPRQLLKGNGLVPNLPPEESG